MRRAAAAVLLALFAVAAPVAGAKPVKCWRVASKSCRKLPTRPTAVHVVVPMVGVNPFAPPAPTPAPAASPVPSPESPAPDPASPPPPAPAPARLGVTAREWSLTLSRTSVKEGVALVELQNFGEDAHNLRIERTDGPSSPLDVPLAEAGERQKASGTLAAGTYKVYCALPGHDAQGMHATLLVR
jgi:hypothetical protein